MSQKINILYVLIFSLVVTFSFVLTKIIWNKNSNNNQTIIAITLTFTSLVFGLLLSFTVSNFWNRYVEIGDALVDETDKLKDIYRIVKGYPGTEGIIASIKNYAEQTINIEWPILNKGGKTFNNDKYYIDIIDQINKYADQNSSSNLTNSIYNLIPERGKFKNLILFNHGQYLIILIIIVAILTLFGFWFIKNENYVIQIIIDFGIITLISLSLFLLIDLQNPFTGVLSIQPTLFQELLDEINGKIN